MVSGEEWNKAFESMSDDEVIDWVICRIEQEGWTDCLDELNEQEKDFVRGVRFEGMFGNGGLPYFFECDHFGHDTVGSLRRLGLPELAEYLDRTFAYAHPSVGCPCAIDLDRMTETGDPIYAGLEEAMWFHFKAVTPALAAFVRRNPDAFAHLLSRAPYDPHSR